jgi:SAM-dependent methyltransferase
VIDIGGAAVNGSYRNIFNDTAEFIGLDLQPGPGVDVALDDPYILPFLDGSIDIVISGQMLEHCAQFWRLFTEIARVLKLNGVVFMIAPSAGPIHRYPVDCYRFYPDSYRALADWSGLRLVDCWLDERGPWRDLVGVFQKGGALEKIGKPKSPSFPPQPFEPNADRSTEIIAGKRHYIDVLTDLHRFLDPKLYLEIGVRKGRSLSLAQCKAIGVDPGPELETRPNDLDLFSCTSDDFFFFYAKEAIKAPIDLAFIDGMHLAEFVYRDFMYLERFMAPSGAIVIDDVLPNHPLQAARDRETQVWCGDVWRFAEVLAEMRPDLKLTWLDTIPTGLLVVSNLNPTNTILLDRYNPEIRKMLEAQNILLPAELVERRMAVAPTEERIRDAASVAWPEKRHPRREN